MYVFEDPEPNGEVEQDLMMELDYRTLRSHVEMCVCVCVVPRYKCVCVYLHTVIFCKLDHFHVCTCHLRVNCTHVFLISYSSILNKYLESQRSMIITECGY